MLSYALLAGAVALLLYSLGVGLALMAGGIAPDKAYLWMMVVPLALAFWHAYGFGRETNRKLRDNGLLVSAGGWLAGALCLLALHSAAQATLHAGLRLDQMSPSPLAWIFALACVAGLVCGALLSWRHWQSQSS